LLWRKGASSGTVTVVARISVIFMAKRSDGVLERWSTGASAWRGAAPDLDKPIA
jgi:hypothetical protein